MDQSAQPAPVSSGSIRVEVKIIAAFATALLALALVGAATYLNAHNLLERNKLVIHTYQVISQIDDVFSSLDDIESGARGYLLTGKNEYLQPYQTGLDAVGGHLDELRKMTADNPLQQRNIERLQSLVNRSIDRVHRQVIARQLANGASAAPPPLDDKDTMDQVRFVTAGMRGHEMQLLERRDRLSAESAHRTVTNFGLLLLLAVLLLFAFYQFIRHDLRERRRNDEALQVSEKKVRAVMDSAPDAMLITDEKGQIQMVNLQAKQLFGFSRTELLERNLSTLVVGRAMPAEAPAHDDPSDRLAEDRAFRDMRSMAAKFDGVRKGGDSFPLDLSRSPLDIGGEHLLITSIRDRTERENAEEALRKFSLDLARSNAELERFAYVASHDLQEPLRMVSSYTQLLAKRYKGKLDANADEFINYAVDGASRMQKLINDLLALSRVGTQAKPSEPVDTGMILSRVLSDLQAAIESAGATVVKPDQMPTVLADGTQIGQLFQNLVGNAFKFRGEKPPRLEVRVEPAPETGFWRFAFQDNGIGIEPQYFERIFVIFQRLHSKESYPGTGIGLAICKKIVERHGGRLWVDSKVGEGTTFFFTLPEVAVS